MKHILIVEDDIDIGNILEISLKKEGFATSRCFSGTEATLWLDRHKTDLILLDLMLPGLSGEEVLAKVSSIPVMVISAKVQLDDKVNVLLAGAWDYVTKPFEIREVIARAKGILQRSGKDQSHLSYRNIIMNPARHEVQVNGQFLTLTPSEFAILEVFLEHPQQVLSRFQVLELVGMKIEDCTESSLKTHISHLRKKLRESSGEDYISSIWGIGFKLGE